MQYDGAWSIASPPNSSPPPPESWPVLSNGAIALVPSLDAASGVDALRSVIALPPERGYGRSLPAFHFTRVRVSLQLAGAGGAPLVPLAQAPTDGYSLDMLGGALNVRCVDSATRCTIVHTLRALMHLPGSALHSIVVTVPPGLTPPSGATLQVTHEVRAPEPAVGGVRFRGESLAGAGFLLSAEADAVSCTGESGETVSTAVACASAYLFDAPCAPAGNSPPPAYAEQRGRRAYATFYVSAPPCPTSASPVTLSFHVLTSAGTGLDAMPSSAMPASSVQQSCFRAAIAQRLQGADALIEGHRAAWAARWATYVDVPAADTRIRGALRYAAYNLHACARPLGPAIDLAGTTLAGGRGDDFVGPLLTLFAPGAARSSLEYRFASLAAASATARSAGLPGARFPHAGELDGDMFDASTTGDLATDDARSSAASPSWWAAPSSSLAVRLHATAMVAVDAWNYYRATQDDDWLERRGYPILRAAADLLSGSAVRPDPVGAYRLPFAVGVDVLRPASTDPPLLVVAVVAAMRCAIEAAYQLGLAPPELWTSVRYGLQIRTMPKAPLVFAADAGGPTPAGFPAVAGSVAAQAALTPGTGPLAVAEPLMAFAEPVASLADALAINPSALGANLAFWGDAAQRVASTPLLEAVGDLVLLHATAQAAQLDAAQAPAVLARLEAILDRHADCDGGWGNLRPGGGPAAAPNDLGLSAQLLLAFVQGLGGAFVQGGVTQAQFVYASLGVNASTSSCMPAAWDRLLVYGLGPARVDVVLINNGGGGGSRTDYAAWSVTTLTL